MLTRLACCCAPGGFGGAGGFGADGAVVVVVGVVLATGTGSGVAAVDVAATTGSGYRKKYGLQSKAKDVMSYVYCAVATT